MNAVSLGPLVFSTERFTAILAIAAFLIAAEIIGRGRRAAIATWAWQVVVIFVIAGRLGHVALNLGAFWPGLWRIAAIWQGGFWWPAGLVAAWGWTVWRLRPVALWPHAALPVGAAGLAVLLMTALTSAPAPRPLPDLALAHVDGRGATVPADLAGRPMVINLWATWCPPCRRELPMLIDTAAATPDVTFLFANQGETASVVRDHLTQAGLAMPDHMLLDPASGLASHYRLRGLPVTLFIGTDGQVARLHLGEIAPEVLARDIARLRAAP
ncbi:redoxin family protein [Paracoccus sp. p3-h83]|uniref:redoxin family protein n=1 Tax=Paracoccus sp. p3-h83 TaxID=3342805 RepID=UPI0035BB6C8F